MIQALSHSEAYTDSDFDFLWKAIAKHKDVEPLIPEICAMLTSLEYPISRNLVKNKNVSPETAFDIVVNNECGFMHFVKREDCAKYLLNIPYDDLFALAQKSADSHLWVIS